MHIAEQKKYTEADYNLLEEGAPFQLINGDLIMSPSPILFHQLIVGKLHTLISNFIAQTHSNGLVVLSPMDVKFDEENIFQPDLLFISETRRAEVVHERIAGAPDLVIEILSPSTAYYDLMQKKDVYERFGVKEYLIIDPIRQIAELHVLENEVFTLKQKEAKNGFINLTTLPGLQIDLQKLFA
ncbi:MAG: Uma2 family endonuclease [Sphingobacteriaceae bacterium]|nr:MAG: Uma2 family endonuclease [Sphingobacteriaceae bacterium]